jgi:branched-chain amino acid transport system substrate-binding protein
MQHLKLASVLRTLVGIAAVGAAAFSMTAQAQTIRIGAPLPVTGALSPEGTKLRQGYDLWLEAVNKEGGINVDGKKRPVEIVYGDYQSNTPRAIQLTERLITQDKVDYLFSPFGSGATKAASTVAERYGIPMISSSASSIEVFDQGYKNLFSVYTENATFSEPLADIIQKKIPNAKRVAILARNDLYPLSLANEFEKSAKKRNFDVAYFQKYQIGTLDHAAEITKIKASNPDWIIVTGYINDLILVRKQLADQKVQAQALTLINGPAYDEWIEASGDLANNVTTASWFHSVVKYPSTDVFGSSQNYVKAFKDKYKATPDFTQASGSAVGVVLQEAIQRAKSIDHDKVRAELQKGGFKTFFGPISFAPSGIANSYVPPVMQVQNGKIEVIYPEEIKSSDFRIGVK